MPLNRKERTNVEAIAVALILAAIAGAAIYGARLAMWIGGAM